MFLYCVADSKRGKDLKVHSPESDEMHLRGGNPFTLTQFPKTSLCHDAKTSF